MIPLCEEEGIAILPWSPLARGYLTRPPGEKKATARGESDDYSDLLYDFPEADEIVGQVGEIAENRGVPRAQVALAWLLAKPEVTAPIIGATKMSHLDDAIAAVELDLSEDEVARLEESYPPRPVRGHH